MINISRNAKLEITWNVSPYDYSQDSLKVLQAKFAKKYNLPKESIKILPDFKTLSSSGDEISVSKDIINNIQNPSFQISLFKEFLTENNIQNFDFDFISNIDNEINSKINYDLFDKYRKYSIKWIKWDNFLSYSNNNFFDFSSLSGLVLLNGEPANQSGKTTFAIDLLHFLLFGKTTKVATQDKIFNKHLLEATDVVVEGCLVIDGDEYIIKRKLTRPALNKRSSKSKTTQKVEYYKIVGGTEEELVDYVENQQEESTTKTNKAIKDVIGNEDDFDMIICATSSNLDSLIEKKDTERGRLLSRWIGLLPIEQKEAIARDIFNSSVKKRFISNLYNTHDLQDEIDKITQSSKILLDENIKYKNEIKNIDNQLIELEKESNRLLSAKYEIDNDIISLDINTLNKKTQKCIEDGKRKKLEKENALIELEKLKHIDFSINEYNSIIELKNEKTLLLNDVKNEYKHNQKDIKALKDGEFCPFCKRKYEDKDYSKQIDELVEKNKELERYGKSLSDEINSLDESIKNMTEYSEKYKEKTRLEAYIPSLDVTINSLRSDYKELNHQYSEYKKNQEAIDKNNQIDISINNIKSKILNCRNTRDTDLAFINKNKMQIENNEKPQGSF